YRISVDADRRERYLALPKLLEALRLKTEHVGVKIQDRVHILDVQYNMVHCRNTKHCVILLWLSGTVYSHTTRAVYVKTLPRLPPQGHRLPTSLPLRQAVRLEYDSHHLPRLPGR